MPGLGKSGTVRMSCLSGSQLMAFCVDIKGLLPGSFNLKGAERCGFALGEFVFDDGVDAAAARAFVQLRAKVGEVFAGAGRDDFNVARVGVTYPAIEAELGCFAMDEPAEADALDAAADEEVEDHSTSRENLLLLRDEKVFSTVYLRKNGHGGRGLALHLQ